ncbi:MAG: hypothetical protein Q9N02_00495, partial [Ghiorsea sp.]|nr:hypothetical protein [Ghiorsea sp.]
MSSQANNKEKEEHLIRRLQYRLRRQGMLELDAWLAPLAMAINTRKPDVLAATKEILTYEVPDLLAMQAGDLAKIGRAH